MSQMKGHARLPGWSQDSEFLIQKSKCSSSLDCGQWALPRRPSMFGLCLQRYLARTSLGIKAGGCLPL